jgi:hypothetical protein
MFRSSRGGRGSPMSAGAVLPGGGADRTVALRGGRRGGANIRAVMAQPEAAAPPAPPALLGLLAKRLPPAGPILWLGIRQARKATARQDLEHRVLDSWAALATAAFEPGKWRAIVLDAGPQAPPSWAEPLERLRPALAADGHLFVLLGAGEGAGSDAAASDAVGSMLEGGFSLVHEDLAQEDTGDGGALSRTTLVLDARPDPHVVRSYRDGDEEAILRLFAASFTPDRGLDHWRWKYRDNPFGTLAISCAFAPGGELVAHYAAYPVPFRRTRPGTGATLLCHQVGDTMTDRHHRHVGRGRTSLLGRTARHFYARRCERKVAFNYGFNTGNIQRFSELFVGARKVWDIELWSARAADLRLAPPRRFRPYRATTVDCLGPEFDDFFTRVAPGFGLLVERRRPYLEWRYLRCPDAEYRLHRVDRGGRLVGWGVVRADRESVLLGDALFDPDHPDAISALLRAVIASDVDRASAPAARSLSHLRGDSEPLGDDGGELRIEGWFSRHPAWWTERLTALGFTASPEPRGLGMVFVPFLECPQRELEQGYYLTMGDGDLF